MARLAGIFPAYPGAVHERRMRSMNRRKKTAIFLLAFGFMVLPARSFPRAPRTIRQR